MKEYTFITRDDAPVIKNFLEPDIYEGFFTGDCRYAVCASEDADVCGVGVFDARKIIEIVDITVLPKYRGILEKRLLHELLQVIMELPYDGITMDVYDSADPGALAEALIGEGFVETDRATLYRFPLADLQEHPLLEKVTDREGIVPLAEIPEREKKSFSNMLIRNRYFENLLSEDISDTLSPVYVKDGRILGCVLLQILDEGTFYVDYVYTDKDAPPQVFAMLLGAATEMLTGYFADTEADGLVLSTSERTQELLLKLLPFADQVDRCRTFAC
jgi:hypothetical protein